MTPSLGQGLFFSSKQSSKLSSFINAFSSYSQTEINLEIYLEISRQFYTRVKTRIYIYDESRSGLIEQIGKISLLWIAHYPTSQKHRGVCIDGWIEGGGGVALL